MTAKTSGSIRMDDGRAAVDDDGSSSGGGRGGGSIINLWLSELWEEGAKMRI